VGYDAGKRVKGRKLLALVDVEGLPLRLVVHSAGMQDRDGAAVVLDKIRQRFPWLELVWADSGYNAHQVKDAVARVPALGIEIVKRSDDMKGFIVLPRRLGGRAHLLLVRAKSPPCKRPRRTSPTLSRPSSPSPQSNWGSGASQARRLLSQSLSYDSNCPITPQLLHILPLAW
jgi:transposase